MEPGDGYSIQDVPAHRVLDVTDLEADELDRRAVPVGDAVDRAAAAAGPGSPVAVALGELRATHDRLAADLRARLDRATTGARTAVDAYVSGDREMAAQYVPPVVPLHPVLPDAVADALRRDGRVVPLPR